MKSYYCSGFVYDTEEELKQQLNIDEYLDLKHGKNANSKSEEPWLDIDEAIEMQEPISYPISRDLYVVRKIQMMTQRDLAKVLKVGVETISKIEKGDMNIRKSTLSKIKTYLESIESIN